MAHTKAGGSTKLGRDSAGQRLGVKRSGGQQVLAGSILVRQRGTAMTAGSGAKVGRDHTIYATRDGAVKFSHRRDRRFTGSGQIKTIVGVE